MQIHASEIYRDALHLSTDPHMPTRDPGILWGRGGGCTRETGTIWQIGVLTALSGSHRSTHIASDLASRVLASQARPQRESESQAFRIARSEKTP